MSNANDAIKSRFGKHILALYKKRDGDRVLYGVDSLAGEVSTRRTLSAP